MYKSIIRNITIFVLTFLPFILSASENEIEMADTMRANGKIYVVVAVVSVVLLCLLIYLLIIDRKVRKIESGRNPKN